MLRKTITLCLLIVVSILFTIQLSHAQQEVYNCQNYLKAGDYQRAIEAGKKAVKFYPRNLEAYFCLGVSYRLVGEFDLALSHMKEAERLATSKSDLSFIYNQLGLIYRAKGDLDNALLYHSRSLSICKETGNKQGEAAELSNIASIYRSKGELDKALDYYEQSLKLTINEKDKISTYNNIALIYSEKNNFKKAEEYFLKGIDIATKTGAFHDLAILTINLGDNFRRSRDFVKAEQYLKDGLNKILRVGDKYWEAGAYKYLGWLYSDIGNMKLAKDYLTKAYQLFNSIGAKADADDALFSLLMLDSQKKKTIYAGIEIGSKGVKAMAAEITETDKEGFYNIKEIFRQTINTSIISGVRESGAFQQEAIEETADATRRLLNELLKLEGINRNEIVIVGSSALYNVKNRDELSKKVKEKTGKELYFIDKDGEILYGIIGSVPNKYLYESVLIDIGSGNTKLGYIENNPFRTISVELPYGTVSLTDEIKKSNPSDKAFISLTQKFASSELAMKLKNEVSKKPAFVNRKQVYMVGGIAWAMATILYPENQNSFVKLSGTDIEKFYNMLINKRDKIFEIDRSKIKNEDIRKKAEEQIKSVKDVFTVENLISGATILNTIANELKLKNREIYFSRNGNWMWGYIKEAGMEKLEKELSK